MSYGTDIAAEIAEALAEAGEAVGKGPFYCTLQREAAGPETPWDATASQTNLFEMVALEGTRQLRDMSGNPTGKAVRTLTLEATGIAPTTKDRIAVGVRRADVTPGTAFEEIAAVNPVAPAGVALMFEIELKT